MIFVHKTLQQLQRVTLIAICTLLFFNTVAHAQDEQLRELYDNPEQFNQLSGAAQNLMRIKFGPRLGEKINSDPSFSDREIGTSENNPESLLLNSLVNNPAADATAQDTQNETAIVLGSGSNIIGSFNDSGSNISGASKFTGFSTSNDGGNSWTDGGTLPTNAFGDAGDPVLVRDNLLGFTYLATLQFTGSGNNLPVFKSTNDGATWLAPVVGTPGKTGFQDKEWMAVDNFAGAGQSNLYLVSRDFGSGNGIYFFRSTDQGATFSPSGGTLIVSGNQGAWVDVGTDHSVYVYWYNSSPRSIQMRKSTDQGLTFGAAVTLTTLTSTATNGDLTLPAGFRSSSFPAAAVNAANGNLYVVYNDPSAATGGDRGNIFFRQSTNGGTTWSAAVLVNDDGTTRAQYIPSIAVKPDGSGLSVTWYDNRNDPSNLNIERWGVTATISGSAVTFGANFRISPQFVPVFGVDPVVNTTYMGDYDMMAADNTYFHTLWGDNRDQSIFVPSRKNANVRHAKFTINGPGAIPAFISSSVSVSGGNGNGIIDFNECNDIFVTLGNDGNLAATGISSTLATSTSGVSVTQSTSLFPNVPARGNGTNATAFKISTSPSFVCGTIINLTITVNYSGGSEVFNFQLPSGSAGSPILFNNNTPTPIADNTTTNIPIVVSGFAGAIGKVTFSLHATHTWDEDLDIYLIAPDGTSVELSTDNGSNGDNYGSSCAARTIFDDDAASSITSGTAPFVGTFKPEGLLAALKGKSGIAVNGTWTLRIIDDVSSDVGTFQCATLSIAPLVCTDGGGECPLPTNLVITVIPEGFYDTGLNRLNMKDTVRAYLRSIDPPYAKVDSAKAVIDSTTFTGNFAFWNVTNGTYYLALNHRNSIETWYFTPGTIVKGGSYGADFTTAQSNAYGSNMIQKGTKWCIYSGDVNQDGLVDGTDLAGVDNDNTNFASGYVATDLTGDNSVDGSDLALVDNNSTAFVTKIVPPGAIAVKREKLLPTLTKEEIK